MTGKPPRSTLGRMMLAVAILAACSAIASRWLRPPARPEQFDPSGPLMSMDPPNDTRYADPYDPDRPPPPPPR